MRFRYKIIKEGQIVEGAREAADKMSLSSTLEKEGVTVVFIEEERKRRGASFGSLLSLFQHVSPHDRISFAHNLGAMIEAGLAITRALSVMERQAKNPKIRKVIQGLGENISQGRTLSDSMKDFPEMFSPLFVSMVRAGEESGNLAGALKMIASQMDKTYQLSKKVRGAMVYPAVIITIMIGIGILMLIYVVPTLTSTFQDLNIKLPATTRFVITLSDFLREQYLLVAALLGAAFFGAYTFFKSSAGGRSLDWAFLHLPVLKVMVREINSARTARTLSSLLSAGVDVVVALSVTRDVLQNSYYKEVLDRAVKAIEQGKSVSGVFAEREDLYPVFFPEMVSVGEETGKIGDMLLGVANFYEDEVDQKTKNLSTIIEPLLMVVIGAGVGFFAISMLAPTYSLVDAI